MFWSLTQLLPTIKDMKYLLLFFLLASRTALSQALDSVQVTTIPPDPNFKFSYITEVGSLLAFTSTPNMQAFFRQNQIKRAFPLDPFVYVDAGGRYRRFKLFLQAGYATDAWAYGEREGAAARRTSASYSGTMLGYDVLNGRNHRVYLNVGVGGVFYEYSVYSRTTQAVAFSNILQSNQPGNIASLKLSNTYWDINLELSQREKRKLSASVVVRVGYRQGWRAEAWESGAFPLTDAPRDRIGQFYLTAGYYLAKNYVTGAK